MRPAIPMAVTKRPPRLTQPPGAGNLRPLRLRSSHSSPLADQSSAVLPDPGEILLHCAHETRCISRFIRNTLFSSVHVWMNNVEEALSHS